MPERTCADDPHFDEPDKSTEANSARDFPSFKSTQLPQVDSHEEAAENIISYKPQLALSREELQRIRAICLQVNDAIEEQQRHVACHEAAPKPPDHVKTRHYRLDIYEISASERRSGVFIGREDERLLKEQLKRTRAEAKQLELQVRKLELRDSQYERKLDGRSSTIPDSINLEKIYNDDLSTTVVESITYNLPKKEWKDPEMQRRCEGHDDGAFGVLRFDGILYRAKAGHERGDFGPFISSNHWREQARALSEIVDHPIEDNYAVHAEPQLMAFFVTRFLQKRNYDFADLCKSETLSELKSLGPTVTITITVSQEVCKICENFRKAVNRLTKDWGYEFEFVNGRKDTDKERERYKFNIWKRPQQT